MKNVLRDKILKVISELKLDLTNKTVLTEAATGAYVVTPIIAAAAGAKVIAFTKSTKYGTVEDVKNETQAIAQLFPEKLNIEIVESLTPEMLQKVDIITNSGHLRPINDKMLRYVKEGTVISYMYEAWEYREGDLDLEYCKQKSIKVAATNERHPNIDVFNYLGELTVKLIHDSGKCLYKNKFIIISNNDFGYHIAKTLVKLCERVGVFDLAKNKSKYPKEIDWLGVFPNADIPDSYRDTEAIIFTAHPFEDTWIQKDNELNISCFSKITYPFVLRFAGHIDTEYLDEHNVLYYPKEVKPGHMGVLLSAIGYDSVIRLQAGGLKVGELLFTENYEYKNVSVLKLI